MCMPVVRGSDAVMAPECLGELCRLSVADPMGDLSHREAGVGEQFRGTVHADRGEVLSKRRMTDLLVRPLKLASRGGDSMRDVVER